MDETLRPVFQNTDLFHFQVTKNAKIWLNRVTLLLCVRQSVCAYKMLNNFWMDRPIDNANNLVFWCHFLNKLEPWHIVYIMQQ